MVNYIVGVIILEGQLANLTNYFKKGETLQNSNNPIPIQYLDKKFFQVSAENSFCAISKRR